MCLPFVIRSTQLRETLQRQTNEVMQIAGQVRLSHIEVRYESHTSMLMSYRNDVLLKLTRSCKVVHPASQQVGKVLLRDQQRLV